MAQTDIASDIDHPEDGRPKGRHEVLLEISNSLVRLHKRYYGKGPTKARTVYQGDVIVCVMRGGMTAVEQTLLDAGRAEIVHEHRHQYQQAVREEFIGAVERIVGRKVEAFMSGNHLEPSMVAEVFVLEPMPDRPGEETSLPDSA